MPLSYFWHFFHVQVSVLHLICQLGSGREARDSYLQGHGEERKINTHSADNLELPLRQGQTISHLTGSYVRVSQVQ